MPFVALLVGGGLIVLVMGRWRADLSAPQSPNDSGSSTPTIRQFRQKQYEGPKFDPALRERLERELKERTLRHALSGRTADRRERRAVRRGAARRWPAHHRRIRDAAEAERLEHELGLAMQGLRELDFDREMGKLSDADCKALRERLMAQHWARQSALERLRAKPMHASSATAAVAIAPAARPRPVKTAATAGPNASAPATTPLVRFCPKCGVEVIRGKFCGECDAPLIVPAGRAVGRRAM